MTLGTRQREWLGHFDPRTMPDLELWLDGDEPLGIGFGQPADQAAIVQWSDLSQHARHAKQSISAQQPIFHAGAKAGDILNVVRNPTCDPSIGVNTSFALVGSGGSTAAYDSTQSIVQGCKTGNTIKVTSTGSGGTGRKFNVATGSIVGPCTIGVSMWVKCDAALSIHQYADGAGGGSTGTNAGGYLGTPDITLQPNLWTRIARLYDVDTGVTLNAGAGAYASFTASGQNLWLTDCVIQVFPYKQGKIPHDIPWTPLANTEAAWQGAVANSPIVAAHDIAPSILFEGTKSTVLQATNLPASYSEKSIYIVCNMYPKLGAKGWFDYTPQALRLMANAVNNYGFQESISTNGSNAMPGPSNGYADFQHPVLCSMTQRGYPIGDQIERLSIRTNRGQDGVTNFTSPTNAILNPNVTTLNIGSRDGSAFLTGRIFALLIFSKLHDEAMRRKVENWLALRKNITLARP